MTTFAQLLVDVPNHERIVNMDESCWRVHTDGLRTWDPTGRQNVRLLIDGNEKVRLLWS
jgi:hypothetical protein